MTDRIRTVDMSDPAVVLDCYLKLNVAYKELKAENEKLRAQIEKLQNSIAEEKQCTERENRRKRMYYLEVSAADKVIAELREQNEKLRDALKPFAVPGWCEYATFTGHDLRKAATAYKETGNE